MYTCTVCLGNLKSESPLVRVLFKQSQKMQCVTRSQQTLTLSLINLRGQGATTKHLHTPAQHIVSHTQQHIFMLWLHGQDKTFSDELTVCSEQDGVGVAVTD